MGEPRRDPASTRVTRAMARVTARLPGGGEDRPGQDEMAEAVARAIAGRRHLIVSAGTGTGKSLAYLVPSILSGRRVVVATATKALQDQLATHDLPFLAGALGRPFSFAVLKGRSNYLCRQRAAELVAGEGPGPDGTEQLRLGATGGDPEDPDQPGGPAAPPWPGRTDGGGAGDRGRRGGGDGAGGAGRRGPQATLERGASPLGAEVSRLLDWARRSATGDRAELEAEPSPRAWSLLSVSRAECPGRSRCPSGHECFAEAARDAAAAADVMVVNLHLYVAHLASEGAVLPDHDVVVFDEAHALEDIATAGLGRELSAARLQGVAGTARLLLGRGAGGPADELQAAGDRLDAALAPLAGQRLPPGLGQEVAEALALTAERLARLTAAVRAATPAQAELELAGAGPGRADAGPADQARVRALLAATSLADDLEALAGAGPDHVAWVESRHGSWPANPAPGPGAGHVLRLAPIEVGPVLAERLWGEVTAVLTSATIPAGLQSRLGMPADSCDSLDVGSPFPYPTHGLLYCAAHLPDRRRPGAEAAAHEELASLITAAGGRTLALFTSRRSMQEGARLVRERVPFCILTQDEAPKGALLAAFSAEESACLFATMGFWQGVDVPGPTLSLVVIDRIPFPRPDDPLMTARRERAGAAAFRTIDLPRAAMLLAQGAGRLIRCGSDRGVVAVLDHRLAHASYRWDLVRALPPMARTRRREEVDAYLAGLGVPPV